ncbi:DNA-binding protein [Acinetobacter cumulans]|uniref:DNA-binding protein n=1 Tax=Acinetobacter cumulans TaxID=2136182 RepID=UPI00207B253D|nr:DNA-binding protein [Acinetobacter cumulans]
MNTSIPMIKLIEAMNDQPIAFNKHYVFIGCGINGALMLSQLVYWTSRTRNKDGWIYKTHEEWTQETGLTRREQDTARKTLKSLGFLIEKKVGVPCKLHFRVERENLYKALIKYSESLDSSQLHNSAKLDAQMRQSECTDVPDCMHNSAKLDAQISPTNTENTYREYTENTSESVVVENPSENQNPSPEQNSVEHTLKIWTPNLDSLNSWLQRSGLPKITQAQSEEILLELNPHYESKIHTGAVSDTQMYSNFVKWVKRDSKLTEKLFEKATQSQFAPAQPQNLNLPEKPKGFLGGRHA